MLYKSYVKRIIDIAVSTLSIVLLLPVFVLLALALLIANRGSPFFIQKRPGKGGKVFSIIKLKTMNSRRDETGELLPDAERLTPVGALIRNTSLDEIPQLLNVLLGSMSLIGPRPLLVEYLHLYTPEESRRHDVKPGITGWAQVNGRNAITWQQKFEYDIWYVDHISLRLDWKIFIMTIEKVIKREDIAQGGRATVDKFRGNA